MPIFTAIAAGVAAVAGAIGFSAAAAATIGAVGAFAARTLLTIGISKLISNTTDTQAPGSNTPAADPRAQKSPTTVNKIPVVYGSAFVGPTITDAILSTDQTTMYYVCALSEVTDTGEIYFGNILYNGDYITLGTGGDIAKVISLTNNAVPPQTDTKIAGNMFVYLFNDGSSSGVNTGGLTAIQILSDASIPVDSRWTSTDTMTNCAFAVIKLIYNQDAGTTQLGQLNFQLFNTCTKPGTVIFNYLYNPVYGCNIPESNIDVDSLVALNAYSDELIEYVPVGGGIATQPRYRINGPINTGQNCLANLQDLCDACDSWLQYSELTGQWKVVINQSYEQAGESFGDLFLIDSSVLIGGIDINPIDLNSTYNSLEVGYPNVNINDQTDYKVFYLIDYVPEVMSPNEAANQLVVTYPQVNNYVQAGYLGQRRLLQSREDLIITCALDYSGIQIVAGDVVRVTLAEYGWVNKLFRVSQVQEVKDESGFLGARITAFEYNGTIYEDTPLDDFVPEANTGLTNPLWLELPGTPTISLDSIANATVASFTVTSSTPPSGSTMFMDFNYGLTNDVDTHQLYASVQTSTGKPWLNNEDVSIHSVNLPIGTYYWSTTARTSTTGYKSLSSDAYVWGGPNITRYTSTIKTGASSVGTTVFCDTTGVVVGQEVSVESGTGSLPSGVVVAAILGAGSLLLSAAPLTTLASAALKFFGGGAKNENISNGAISANKMVPNSGVGPIYLIYYDPSFTAGVISSASSTSTRNISLSYPSYNPSPNDIFPWAQGTSSTANGYAANSTGPFTPDGAGFQTINEGDSGWYKLAVIDISTDPFSFGDIILENGLFTFFTDTSNSIVQICSYFKTSATAGDARVLTPQIQTFTITNTDPWPSYVAYNVASGYAGGTPTTELGIVVRNLTPGANVSCIMGTYSAKQNNG